jgi:hypothetical protein
MTLATLARHPWSSADYERIVAASHALLRARTSVEYR